MAVKFGINTSEILPIFNATPMVFIANFTDAHAIISTNTFAIIVLRSLSYKNIFTIFDIVAGVPYGGLLQSGKQFEILKYLLPVGSSVC